MVNNYPVATIWKNGVGMNLPFRIPGDYFSGANSIFINGNDIYVAGTENGIAVYWKNGSVVGLPGGDADEANSICVFGNDIYVAGYAHINGADRAVMWKNGMITVLKDASENSSATSIFVK